MTWGPEPGEAWAPGPPPGTPPAAPSPGATAWYPDASPDTVRRPVVVSPGPPPPVGPSPSPNRPPRAAVVVVAVTLVVAVAVAIVLVVGHSGDDSPTPQAGIADRPAAASTPAPTDPVLVTATVTVSTTPTPTPTPARTPGQTYTGPGGISVQGPAGWVSDTTAGIASVADFRAPTSPERLRGSTFRIGIGNPDPGPSFSDEVQQSVSFLQSQYGATIIGQTATTFFGVDAVDIEYSYYKADLGVQRHGVERLWRDGSITLIIQSSDVDANWPAAAAVFQQLVTSATVT